jgi:hypothetical protein
MYNNASLEVVFDNAGGVTVQDSEHVFFFGGPIDGAAEAGECLRRIFDEETTFDEWFGNEEINRLKNYVECKTMDFDDLHSALMKTGPIDDSRMGTAQGEFLKAFTGRNLESEVA